MSALEDRYRRLLRWYPAEHRRVHEEEMLGVLLAAAGPGRSRPPVRDALDLVLGGVGIRLRRASRSFAGEDWRDAAALLSVIAPLFLLADAVRYAVTASVIIPEARYAASRGASWTFMFHSAPAHLLWAVVAVAAMAGARRTAMAGTVAAIAVEFANFILLSDYAGGTAFAPILLGLITVVALAAGSGAARGRALLGRGGFACIIVLLALAASLGSWVVRRTLGIDWGVLHLGLMIAAVLVTGWLVRGAAGRRAAVVLAAPLSPIVAPFSPLYPGYIEDTLTRVLVTMVAIPLTVCVSALVLVTLAERLVIRPVAARGRGSAS